MNRRTQKLCAALAAAGMCAFSAASWAGAENKMNDEMPVKITTIEGASEYRLSNGLKVVLYPDSTKPTATVNMTYLVGSRHENYGETGMAHLLEHLMFKGSRNYPSPTKEFTKRGFKMNGSTWFDRTNYFVSFNASDDNMQWALGWQADAMVNSFIAKKDLDTEMTVVRNEFEMGENQPISVMLKRMQSIVYDWHSYGRSTIGAKSDIENVEIENLQRFYRTYYQPDNAVLTVSGAFDPEKVLGWIQKDFGAIPKPERTLPKEWTVEPTADGEREFYIRRAGETQLAAVAYRIPSALSPEYEPVSMAASILSDEPTGRLYKSLVETGLATKVFGWTFATKDPGFVMFGALVKKGDDLEAVKNKLVSEIESAFASAGATDQELDRQKIDQLTMMEREQSNPEEFAINLSEYIALGDWRLRFADREEIKAVKASDVDAAASKYFVRDNRVVGLYVPTDEFKRAEIPAAPEPDEILARYTFKEEADTGENFDVSADNINARTKIVDVDGVKVALLSKKTKGSTIDFYCKFLNGNYETAKNSAVGLLAMAMLPRGTEEHSRVEIDDLFTKYKMEGSALQFRTDRENFANAVKLAAEIMSKPSFPEKEFETLKRQMIQGLEAKSDDPRIKAQDAMTKHFNTYPEGDARRQPTSAELIAEVKAAKIDDVRKFYDEVFGTTRGFIAIVGDFDEDEAARLLKECVVGAKKPKTEFERIVAEYKPVAPARITIDAPDKENAVLTARVDFPATDSDADHAALITADWILGGSSGLSNRLVNRLRQQEGLSYGVYSMIDVPTFGNRAKWIASAIVAPQNLAQAEASLKDELARAFKDGVTEKELEEAKQGIIDYRRISRTEDSNLAMGWAGLMNAGRDWSRSKATDEAIMALTVEDVNRAVKRIADPNNLTIVLSGDFAKAEEAGKSFK